MDGWGKYEAAEAPDGSCELEEMGKEWVYILLEQLEGVESCAGVKAQLEAGGLFPAPRVHCPCCQLLFT